MIKAIVTNCKILRRVNDSIYSNVAENFQHHLFSLDFPEQYEIENDISINSPGIANIRKNLGANSLLNSFDLFYYINGRFPFNTGHVYIPDGEKTDEVKGDKLNIKELYEKFRGINSHGLVSLPFLCGLNLFLGGKEKTSKEVLTELYSNSFFSMLSSRDSSNPRFQALTSLRKLTLD